jgi:hypothetical protein
MLFVVAIARSVGVSSPFQLGTSDGGGGTLTGVQSPSACRACPTASCQCPRGRRR